MSAATDPGGADLVWTADLGGTHLSTAVIDAAHAAVVGQPHRRVLPRHAGREGLVEAVCEPLLEGAHLPTWSIAVPGPFDLRRGVSWISGLAKLDGLHGVDLRAELTSRLPGLPPTIRFLNDAHAFGLGEWWAGAARGHRRVIAVTLGTGLGSVFLDDGRRVDQGAEVPEQGWLYHLRIAGGRADDLLSTRGLLQRYEERRAGGDERSGRGGNRDAQAGLVDVRELAERARHGDRDASAAFAITAGMLGDLLHPWVTRFAATCVVVGGGIAGAWDLLEQPLSRRLGHATVRPATNPALAPLLGAAAFVNRTATPNGR